MSNRELIEKWLSGSLSEAERESFLKTDDYQALVRLDEALQDYKAPEFDVETALATLRDKQQPRARVVKMRPVDVFLRIAAVITMVLMGYLLIFQEKVTSFSTGIGEKQLVYLPDQSSVQLNATSALEYVASKWEKNRVVELEGEGYFIVAKGSKFDVRTKDGIVSVLGTEFNVRSREAYFEVACYEGHVAVVANKDTVQLLAGNGLRIIDGENLRLEVSSAEPSWTKNESSFESVPFAEVLAEFERQFAVSIEVKNVDLSKRFSGSFTHKDFEIALKSITAPLNLTIDKTSDQHIVISKLEE